MRRYTVAEIDELRRAVETRWLYGTSVIQPDGTFSRQYMAGEKESAVEKLVRTHMLAGHVAKDIYEADKGKAK